MGQTHRAGVQSESSPTEGDDAATLHAAPLTASEKNTLETWKGSCNAPAIDVDAEAGDPMFVRAAARTMQVLSAFQTTDKPLSLGGISKASGLDRSTTQRIVHTLRKLGYIQRDEHDRGFLPGLRLYDHIFDAMRLNGLIQRAVPLLLELRESVDERVDLSLLDDLRLVYATRFQPKRDTIYAMMLGQSVPVYCSSSGWAVLSRMDGDTAKDVLERSRKVRYTPNTLIDEGAILDKAAEAKERGFAVALEQLLAGEIGLSAAILNGTGQPVGTVTITAMLSDRSGDELIRSVGPMLMRTASTLGRGW